MMKKKKDSGDFIKKHEYPGGKKAFQEFILQNLIYPPSALKNKIEGNVYLSYEIGFDGQVTNVTVLKGIGHGCDEECIRLLKLLKFSPQNNHGIKIISKHKIRINFKLPETKKTPVITKITYTTQTKKAVSASKEKSGKPKQSINYTFKF